MPDKHKVLIGITPPIVARANTATSAAIINTDMASARSIARGITTANAETKVAPVDVEKIAKVVTTTKAPAIEITAIDASPVSKATAPMIKAPVK